ncbi:Surfeit protein [Rhodopseudomonas palustris HaA2]|uniref:SURF1-like protein n=1 Tax=Rhodopseudomonas palustris (strain HaA2) TaxID=316058 RepID=Q2J3L1_RHOP2|nr:SURF1 family protein [Rhodopseudomonas palustris]ABD04949.1 Surfeit protein [Rhodopseudomonas palustris HaA2]
MTPDSDPAGSGRSSARRPSLWLTIPAVAAVAGLIALGVWQIERRAWKLALIDRVEQRAHAAPTALPPAASWPEVTAARDEYRRVTVTGRFLHDRETLVQAVTDFGGGFWAITPLRTDDGRNVLINRGFVPPDWRDRATRSAGAPAGEITVNGLLRVTEPGGGFLRHNEPAADRWYSRDVAAIAQTRSVANVAPFFIDADASFNLEGQPIGGLTVIRFPNNHLVYALTWFCLAFMLAGWLVVAFGAGSFRRAGGGRRPGQEAQSALATGSHAGPISGHR